MNNRILKFTIGFTALLLAVVAAYFSISGLAKLFAGSGIAILVMAGTLEFSKLITVSYVYRYWNATSLVLRYYLLIAISILMMITSLGIYGFLTSGYQKTKTSFDLSNTSILTLQNKKEAVDNKIQSLSDKITISNNRIQTLSNQRTNVERRIDKSFDSDKFNVSNKQTTIASNIERDINKLSSDVDVLTNEKLVLMDSSSNLTTLITQNTISNLGATELGPLVYIANILSISIDKAVNFLILLFIFVFDPLAIALWIVFNKMNTNISVNTPSNSSTESKIQLDSDFINTDITSSDLEQKELISTIQSDIPIETNDNSARDFFPKLYNDVRI